MKKFTFLLILYFSFLFVSCGISYDGDERLVLQTNVVDRLGNPLKDIETMVEISDSDTDEIISNGLSDVNGNKLLVFPEPKSARITVYFSDLNNDFVRKSISQIEVSDFTNYKLILENIVLYKFDEIVSFNVLLENTSSNNSLRSLSIEGEIPEINESFHPQTLPEDGYLQTNFSVAKNQQIILKYTIRNNDTGDLTNYSVPIDIGEESVEYTLNF